MGVGVDSLDLGGAGDVVEVRERASLVALVEVVAGRAEAGADGHSAGAASVALAVAGDVHVGQVAAHTPVQLAAHVEAVAAGELLEIEVLAQRAAQVLGLRVVLAGLGIAADVVVGAGLVVGKVTHAGGTGLAVQTEGVLRRRHGGRLVADHLGGIHAVAETGIVAAQSWAGSDVEALADALVVLVAVDGIGQARVVGQRAAGGIAALYGALGTAVLGLVHAGPGSGLEDQLVGAVGPDLLAVLAQDVAAAVEAAGIHHEGAVRLVGAVVLGLLRNNNALVGTLGTGGQDAASELLVVEETRRAGSLLHGGLQAVGAPHPIVAGAGTQQARVLWQQSAHILHRQVLEVLDHAAQGAGHKQQRQDTAG